MALQWYVARTKPLGEYKAADGLKQAGLETFVPCVKSARPRPGHQDMPLFPGYIFLRYDWKARGWPPVHRIPQVLGFIQFEGVAPPVPDQVIGELALRVEAINSTGGVWTRFRPGDRVHVGLGPSGSIAEVVAEAKSPQARVRVLLEFLGRQIYAEVPWQDVQEARDGQLSAKLSRGRAPRRTRGSGRWIKGFGPRAEGGQPLQNNGHSSL